MHKRVLTVIALLLLPMPILAAGQINQQMIDAVTSGKVQKARASWWGFDPEDSTGALQAAINSGAKQVVVENLGKPWIVRPIKLANDQEITFKRGVEVIAKQGEFKGITDCLFEADDGKNIILNGYGATLRMRKTDYMGPDYKKAEWRHILCLRSCTNMKILGLTITESGGDGIYISTSKTAGTNKNITIKDVVCDNNYRQGITVNTAEDLLIENTVMKNTQGTNPEAGIDFEPNYSTERLVNILVQNCRTDHNHALGYVFSLHVLDATSTPVSIKVENCVSVSDGSYSAYIETGNTPEKAVTGNIEFNNCSFQDAGYAGAFVTNLPSNGCKVQFNDCSFLPAPKIATGAIVIQSQKTASEPVGGVDFSDCIVNDLPNRKPIVYVNKGNVPMKGISGLINVAKNDEIQTIELTPQLLDDWVRAK